MPVTALLALWIFATTLTFGPALDLLAARTLLYDLGRPGERWWPSCNGSAGSRWSSSPATATLPGCAEQRQRTDRRGRRAAPPGRRREPARRRRRPRSTPGSTSSSPRWTRCPPGGGSSTGGQVDRAGAIGLYSGMIDAAFQAFSAHGHLPDRRTQPAGAGASPPSAGPGAARPDRRAARRGVHRRPVRRRASTPSWCRPSATSASSPRRRRRPAAAERAAFQRLTEGEPSAGCGPMQDALVGRRPADPAAVDADGLAGRPTTRSSSSCGSSSWRRPTRLAERSVPPAVRILVRPRRRRAAGPDRRRGLGRRVAPGRPQPRVSRLAGLRAGRAGDWPSDRLPDVVGPAAPGRGRSTSPPRRRRWSTATTRSARSGDAFNEVQRTAVQSAVERGDVRRGLNEVFLNIARRSQTLLHRQLALLDRMERRAERPGRAGGPVPGRPPRHPDAPARRGPGHPGRRRPRPRLAQPGADGRRAPRRDRPRSRTTRGSTSARAATVALAGRAVGDVIHLLAELIENATVVLAAAHPGRGRRQLVPQRLRGRDRGPRPRHDRRGAARPPTARLADPPDFDPAETRPARPVRGGPARRPARHPGAAAPRRRTAA